MIERIRPLDDILNFKQKAVDHIVIDDLHFEPVVRFDALPIAGWNDQIDVRDSKCKEHCVKDCSCVGHCAWILA